MPQAIKLAEYLFMRLRQLEVQSIHGVPGDYNLSLLDYVQPQGLHWVGNCNELNAGYAADGYARIKGLGVLITTYGVGELSAINAIAGAYAERAPIIHIVGTPARHLQDSRARIHHTLNDGEYRHFAKMASHVTVAQVNLIEPQTCAEQIDWVIQQCLIHSRPVYIEIPTDMVAVALPAEKLSSKIRLPDSVPSTDEPAALNQLLRRIHTAKRPAILIDGESRPFGILEEVRQLVISTGWPTWTTIFGKSLIDETLPNVRGVWKGPAASSDVDKEYMAEADLVLCVGPHFSSTNTYSGSAVPDAEITILFNSTTVVVRDKIFRDLPCKHILSRLLESVDYSRISKIGLPPPEKEIHTAQLLDLEGEITQKLFYRL